MKLFMDIPEKIRLSRNTAAISGIFCSLVALLLLLNFWQVTRKDPLDSESMKHLVERLAKEPKNEELIEDIRNLDLLARKAYFNSRWQVKTGSYLLLFGAIVFAFALRSYHSLRSKIGNPVTASENEISEGILARRGILYLGGAISVLALVSSFLTSDYLKQFTVTDEIAKTQSIDSGQVQVIEIGKDADSDTIPAAGAAEEITGEDQPVAADSSAAQTGTTEENAPPALSADPGKSVSPERIRSQHNSFRGPFGQGVSYHKNIPVKWNGSQGENILWKVKVPRSGFNSPVIWSNRLFIAGADNQTHEVYCYDKNSGNLLWTKQLSGIPGSPGAFPKVTSDTGFSAPSLTTDGNYVFALFANGDIAAFDMEGRLVWAKNLGVPDNHYGHSSSLICLKDKLYVQYDTNRGCRLYALGTATGDKIWETPRNVKISWASPILAQIGGRYQVVLSADPVVAGYDADTGKELWSVDCMMGEVGPSPAFYDGLVFAGQEYAMFAAIDPVTSSVIWKSDEYLPEVSSPVAANGLVFVATSYGVLACYDAHNGTKYWENESPAGYYSSPMIADGKLFALDLEGNMLIFEVSKEKKITGECPLGEKSSSTPAFSEGRIYIRGDQNLYCIGK